MSGPEDQPEDIHGECAAEIHALQARITDLEQAAARAETALRAVERDRDAERARAVAAEAREARLRELLTKVRRHSSKVFADGDYYAAFNHRYLDEIDEAIAQPGAQNKETT